jgi:hypothetical protein
MRLDRAERDAELIRCFLLRKTFKKQQVDDLYAFGLEFLDKFAYTDHVDFVNELVAVVQQMYEIIRRQVFAAVVKSFRAQLIDGGISGDVNDPGVKPAFAFVIGFDVFPNFDERFLEHIFGFFTVLDEIRNDRKKAFRIHVVQLRKPAFLFVENQG